MPARGEGRGGRDRDRGSEDEARIQGQGGVGARWDQGRWRGKKRRERRVAVVTAEGPREAARREERTKEEMAKMVG